VLKPLVAKYTFLIRVLPDTRQVIVGHAFPQPCSIDRVAFIGSGGQRQVKRMRRDQWVTGESKMRVDA
jgi:hypothetical protein